MLLDPQRFPQIRNRHFKWLRGRAYKQASFKYKTVGLKFGPYPKCGYPKVQGFCCLRCGLGHVGEKPLDKILKLS